MSEYVNDESLWLHAHCNPDTTDDVRSKSPKTAVTQMVTSEDGEVQEQITNEAAELVHYTEVRVAKRSPVKPAAAYSLR